MFIENKYTKWYYQIVQKAQNEKREKSVGLYENHHIIPKSIGGSDRKINRVLLSYKEHFICHWLLPYMVNEPKQKQTMWYALASMRMSHLVRNNRIIAGWQYAIARKANAIASVGNTYAKNGAGIPKSEETKQRMRKPKSPKHCEAIRQAQLRRKKHPMSGKTQSEETRKLMSEKRKAYWESKRAA